jgi:site-specific DNA recombinase
MRVSTANQEDEQTIKSQQMELEERIKKDGVLLIPERVYKDDGWTGSILERPDLDRMRVDARNGLFDVLYAYDRGRVSRKFVHQEIILDELRECGIEFISLHDINGQTTEEVLMGSVMGVFHEYERIKITERMRLGKVRKVRENKKLLGYQPKYGYDYHHRIKTGPDARDGYFTVNKLRAEVIRQIFEWIASGQSKHEVRRNLYENGIMPPKGKSRLWSSGTLDRLLTDTTYYGDHYYNKSESVPTKNPQNPKQKYRKVAKGSRKPRPKEEWMLIAVPKIIEKELFDKVQAQLRLHKKINPRNNKRNSYLVSGLIECVCGNSRTGEPASKGNFYYRCTDRLNRFPGPRTCFEHGINAPVLDAVVWQKLRGLITNPQTIRKQAERWLKSANPMENQANAIKDKLNSLDGEERRYTKAYGEGLMSERLYKEQAREVAEKRRHFNSELEKLEETLVGTPKMSVDQLVDATSKLLRNLDLTDKKVIVRRFITKIQATQKEMIIWGQLPILATEQVGLYAEHRYSRAAERR